MKSDRIIHSSKWIKFLGVALFCFMISPSLSHAFLDGKIENFSADQVIISPDGKVMTSSKLYITKDTYRMDGLPMGGQGGLTRNLTILGLKK